MTVGDVCNREVVIAEPETSVLEAVRLMKTHHVGDVIVIEERTALRVPVGILTDRDVALAILDGCPRLPSMRVKDVMTGDLVTASEHENLYDALKTMQVHGVRRLPVVNAAGGLEGILTFDDVIGLLSDGLVVMSKLVATEQERERIHHVGKITRDPGENAHVTS